METQPATTADLISQASHKISTLFREGLARAKAELAEKVKRAVVGGGLLGGAGLFALYGLGLLIALAVVALDLVWPAWLAVLVGVGGVFSGAGGAAAGCGEVSGGG